MLRPLPEKFITLMREQLGEQQADALCEALLLEPSTSLRLHPRKSSVQAQQGEPIGWSPLGRRLSSRPSFTLEPEFHAGAYYVQEASSQFAGYLLSQAMGGESECEGLRLLDMCAAPGGKSTHYASLVGERGLVVANEISRSRAAVLADNVRKWGMGNVVVSCNDSSRFAQLEGFFDVVAVDAPCSGEGMFRKSEEALQQWSEGNVALCAERQWEILQNAYAALRQGGVLIYSTCTFNQREDEGILQRAMEQWSEELESVDEVAVDESWGVVVGRVGAFQTFRFFPHRLSGEGMFLAVARKSGVAGPYRKPKSRRKILAPLDKSSQKELQRWVATPVEMRFFSAGDTIYACREEHYDEIDSLSGILSVVYSGVAMGQIFKGKLKPDGALAFYVGLERSAVECREVSVSVALAFLRKQEISAEPFAEGINLVLCGGNALGFVKRVGARVNNLYPNSLRILK